MSYNNQNNPPRYTVMPTKYLLKALGIRVPFVSVAREYQVSGIDNRTVFGGYKAAIMFASKVRLGLTHRRSEPRPTRSSLYKAVYTLYAEQSKEEIPEVSAKLMEVMDKYVQHHLRLAQLVEELNTAVFLYGKNSLRRL